MELDPESVMLIVEEHGAGRGEPRELTVGRCMCGGGPGMLSAAQNPARPRAAALSHRSHPAPWSVHGGFNWPGHSDQDTEAGGGI